MAASIPRRPEVPGIPGTRLPRARAIEELAELAPLDDDEPTHPFSSPPDSGTIRRAKSLSVNGLSRAEAAQLAGIIAAWERADGTGRHLLAELAKRLGRRP